MKSPHFLLIWVLLTLACGPTFADDDADMAPLRKALELLTVNYDRDSGDTTWKVGEKILYQSYLAGSTKERSLSPNGKAVHFGSFKQNTQRRVIVAFNLINGQLTHSGGDDLPEKVILALRNSGKIRSNAQIDGCWLDPVRWIEDSKLLITSDMVSQGPVGFEILDFRCVWDLGDGTCEYLQEYKGEKEELVNFATRLPRGPKIQPESKTMYDDKVYDSLPPHLEWRFGPNWQIHASMDTVWIVQGWSGYHGLSDSEIFECWYACEKFEEWVKIAREDKNNPPPSFTKEILLDPALSSRGIDKTPTLKAMFSWEGATSSSGSGCAYLDISFKSSPAKKISLCESGTPHDVKSFKNLLGLVPYMREEFKQQLIEKQKRTKEIDSRFK